MRLLILALLCTSSAQAAELTIRVTGIRNAEGTIRLCVFPGPNGFPDCTTNASVQRRSLPAQRGTVQAVVSVAPGTYAVTAFHDEKNTGKIETNLFGIPRSGVGASNNPVNRFGPPSFADAAFTVGDRPAGVSVTLRYP